MIDLAFAVARSAAAPEPAALVAAAKKVGIALLHAPDPSGPKEPLVFEVGGGGTFYVMPIAARHPDAEKMPHLLTSPDQEDIASHAAHFILTAHDLPGDEQRRELAMTLLTAAVLRTTDCVGVMLKTGIGWHRAEVFADLAELGAEYGELPPQLSLDVSVARESNDRMSLLTHGMRRHGREEILVTCAQAGEGAPDFLYSIAGWLLEEPGQELPTGDTVGRDENEKVKVQRVPNPSGEPGDVIRLDLDT
jgi:hypothetical protein